MDWLGLESDLGIWDWDSWEWGGSPSCAEHFRESTTLLLDFCVVFG